MSDYMTLAHSSMTDAFFVRNEVSSGLGLSVKCARNHWVLTTVISADRCREEPRMPRLKKKNLLGPRSSRPLLDHMHARYQEHA
ncbi:hypothetical protein O181_067400 [Austropuccinia psidii MF-1]|uniref:Uncharacterized protein n=1 Tax=Austropuccinia psidii MF-1 TaxID=1389203 RepID=A0A9Q3EQP9_9BASI|nr:hypothetical protein [Austropuccinia psidii MF-1]